MVDIQLLKTRHRPTARQRHRTYGWHTPRVDDASMVGRAARLILAGDRASAGECLDSIPHRDRMRRRTVEAIAGGEYVQLDERGADPSVYDKFDTHQQYGWRCEYCGRRVVIAGVIELVGKLAVPELWWSTPGMPAPGVETHPAVERLTPNADHIKARSRHRHVIADDSLICACTLCNERKWANDGWVRIVPVRGWHGCVPFLGKLYDMALREGIVCTKAIADWREAAETYESRRLI